MDTFYDLFVGNILISVINFVPEVYYKIVDLIFHNKYGINICIYFNCLSYVYV